MTLEQFKQSIEQSSAHTSEEMTKQVAMPPQPSLDGNVYQLLCIRIEQNMPYMWIKRGVVFICTRNKRRLAVYCPILKLIGLRRIFVWSVEESSQCAHVQSARSNGEDLLLICCT